MQKFLLKLTGLAAAFLIVFSMACESEVDPTPGGGGGNDLPPIVSLAGDPGFLNADATLEPGTTFAVRVSAAKGDNQLKSVRILEDGSDLATDRIVDINTGAITPNNPFLIVGTDKDGATYDITIKVQEEQDVPHTYTFELTDDANNTDQTSISITVVQLTTPLTTTYTALLMENGDGPNPTGGLDLDTGSTVSVNSTDADIKDKGVDLSQPAASNWFQQILPANGAELYSVDVSQIDNFNFATVDTREAVLEAFDKSTGPLAESSTVAVDDVFIVKKGDTYFMLNVAEIGVTDDSNADFYRFDVKVTQP